MIWSNPPKITAGPTVFNFDKLISKPTTKSRKDIPNSERALIATGSFINPNPIGPRITPAMIYAGISGCLNSLTMNDKIVARIIIRPISKTRFP